MIKPSVKSKDHHVMRRAVLVLALVMLMVVTGCRTESSELPQATQEPDSTATTSKEDDTSEPEEEYDAPTNAKRYSDLERVLQELKRETEQEGK